MRLSEKLTESGCWVNRWEVFSDSGKSYIVAQKDNGEWGCSCPHWIHNRKKILDGKCKHIRFALDHIESDDYIDGLMDGYINDVAKMADHFENLVPTSMIYEYISKIDTAIACRNPDEIQEGLNNIKLPTDIAIDPGNPDASNYTVSSIADAATKQQNDARAIAMKRLASTVCKAYDEMVLLGNADEPKNEDEKGIDARTEFLEL